MRLLLACLLWFLISLQVVGGAAVFRRWFPAESPWVGFVAPGMALVCVLCFAEHFIAISSLLWLLPFTALISIRQILNPATDWKSLGLPTAIFVVAFAFTLSLRALKPNVLTPGSGGCELALVSGFCRGARLTMDGWGQPGRFVAYGSSVLTRLLEVDVGTGCNLASALVSAWICFAFSAIAWVVSRKSIWITVAAAILTEGAANGLSAWLYFEIPNLDLAAASNGRPEWDIPGFRSWIGVPGATGGAEFLTLLSVWSLTGVLRRGSSNWPWIGLVAAPFLMSFTLTGGVPVTLVLMIAGLAVTWYRGILPGNSRFVAWIMAPMVIVLSPALVYALGGLFSIQESINVDSMAPIDFLIYGWPLFVPWFALLFVWRRLSGAVRIVYVLTPLFCAIMAGGAFGPWGNVWGLASSVLFPVVAMQRGLAFRILTAALCLSGLASLWSWGSWTWGTAAWGDDVLALEGTGVLHTDAVKARLLNRLSLLRGQVVLTGAPSPDCCGSRAVASFTRNYSWTSDPLPRDPEAGGAGGEAVALRAAEAQDFYAGKEVGPFLFLRKNGIDAVVIWPDDGISDEVVDVLKSGLAPAYEYVDFREGAAPNAGVFVYHPGLEPLPVADPVPPGAVKD